MREEALERDEIYRTPTPEPEMDATWLQVQELEVGDINQSQLPLLRPHSVLTKKWS